METKKANRSSSDDETDQKTIIVVCLGTVVLAWGILSAAQFWVATRWTFKDTATLTDAANVGQAFGMVGSLFAALAFAGVVLALILQRRELKVQHRQLRLQRKELILTRRELERTANSQKEQSLAAFYTAYLNAVSAYREARAADLSYIKNERAAKYAIYRDVVEATETITETLKAIQDRWNDATGTQPTPKSERIQMADQVLEQIMILRGLRENDADNEEWVAKSIEAIGNAAHVLSRIVHDCPTCPFAIRQKLANISGKSTELQNRHNQNYGERSTAVRGVLKCDSS